MVDRARRSGREILLPEVHFEAAAPSAVNDPYPDIVAQWEDPDAIAVAQAFIQRLPPELAGVHHALYVESLSQRDAAARLGLTRQKVRTLEGKLRAGLRAALLQRRPGVGPTEQPGPTSSMSSGRRLGD
jgi:DNA-directed RNA polymerase specialized sigma24 family protein